MAYSVELVKYFRRILLLLLKRHFVIIKHTSINLHILNKSNKKAFEVSEPEFCAVQAKLGCKPSWPIGQSAAVRTVG